MILHHVRGNIPPEYLQDAQLSLELMDLTLCTNAEHVRSSHATNGLITTLPLTGIYQFADSVIVCLGALLRNVFLPEQQPYTNVPEANFN